MSPLKGAEILEGELKPPKTLASLRKALTEQANAVAVLLTVSFSALIYGWIEGKLWPLAKGEFQLEIANHFTWYHVAFFLLFAIIGFSLSINRLFQEGRKVWYLIVASLASMVLGFWLEDMSYFATTYPSEMLQKGVWVEWGLGGFRNPIFGNYVPTMYVVLSFAGFVAFGSVFLLARRDRIRMIAKERNVALDLSSIKALINGSVAAVCVALLVEWPLISASAFTSFSQVGPEARIVLLGLVFFVPTILGLVFLDLAARRRLI